MICQRHSVDETGDAELLNSLLKAELWRINMNLRNIEYTDIQNTYLKNYQDKWQKAIISTIFLLFIPILNLIFFSVIESRVILPELLQHLLPIVFKLSVIISIVASIYYIIARFEHTGQLMAIIIGVYLVIFSIYNDPILALLIAMSIYIPLSLGIVYIMYEGFSFRYAKNVVKYITTHEPENHTAVILPHDAKRAMDGGDKPVLKLIEVLTKYSENFQIYFCLDEKDMINALTNPYVKRIWIFGHGDRGCCGLTDKVFTYAEFMTEKTDTCWKLRDIEPKEYVYQCHCNPGSTRPLTDYLLKNKGTLNSDVDDMPNYNDSGIADMKIAKPRNYICLSLNVLIFRGLKNLFNMDLNYNNIFSNKYFIDRYADHLEKKCKLLNNKTNEQSN